MTDHIIANMRDRSERCRRLAQGVSNPQDSATLLKMADEIEADTRKLEQERKNDHLRIPNLA